MFTHLNGQKDCGFERAASDKHIVQNMAFSDTIKPLMVAKNDTSIDKHLLRNKTEFGNINFPIEDGMTYILGNHLKSGFRDDEI